MGSGTWGWHIAPGGALYQWCAAVRRGVSGSGADDVGADAQPVGHKASFADPALQVGVERPGAAGDRLGGDRDQPVGHAVLKLKVAASAGLNESIIGRAGTGMGVEMVWTMKSPDLSIL
ncbi:MAG: hypothetical protein WBN04_01430 [Paracoccaceae bacterium]